MTRQQVHPSPGLDPGFRLSLDGRASFVHEGFPVDIHVRPATVEDLPYYNRMEPSRNDVVITGTITLEGVEVAEVSAGADFNHPYRMGEALDEVLSGAVSGARDMVETLVKRVLAIDAKHAQAAAG
ncbi:hypothetical protein OG612_45495 (plasmid) [Streptomyces sp. NBC_01527]|uniref:hypothetical protein n=1 Tax=Streptomyces sp. NBC_01527 TaxID=2903894 RepID=UPI002F910983